MPTVHKPTALEIIHIEICNLIAKTVFKLPFIYNFPALHNSFLAEVRT